MAKKEKDYYTIAIYDENPISNETLEFKEGRKNADLYAKEVSIYKDTKTTLRSPKGKNLKVYIKGKSYPEFVKN